MEYQPEDCLEVMFAGCFGTTAETYVNGLYVNHVEECPGAITAAAYYNMVTEMFMYKTAAGWMINAVCGLMSAKAYGGADEYPFLDTAPTRQCSNSPSPRSPSQSPAPCTKASPPSASWAPSAQLAWPPTATARTSAFPTSRTLLLGQTKFPSASLWATAFTQCLMYPTACPPSTPTPSSSSWSRRPG